MLDNLNNYKIILASASPRRRELMLGLDVSFEVRTLPDVDESFPAELRGGDIPLFISRKKADAYRPSMASDELVITADTIVWLDDKALGKPANADEARRMLRNLSGKTHNVFTQYKIIQNSYNIITRRTKTMNIINIYNLLTYLRIRIIIIYKKNVDKILLF